MDVSLLIRTRLKELGLGQKDLAAAAEVTESYMSQLLARKKAPPAPGRTDIYEKMGAALRLPPGELASLAEAQRREELLKKVADTLAPIFPEGRDLILRKCAPARQEEVRRIFEKQPFGELERLVTQKLLDVTQGVAREELANEGWLHLVAQFSNRTYEQVRVGILEFLDTGIFDVSVDSCISFLDPLIESWDIDLKTFGITVFLNRRLATVEHKHFEFAEQLPPKPHTMEPGLERFLADRSLSGGITAEELQFLESLPLNGRRPAPIYYYRELQNLRDPLHFPPAAQSENTG